ncbi:MAG: hypothetical protein K2X06_03040 [Burkholderiales bacterium]|nr:hypothetical protein [Burkholderiales bacterium]
MGKRLMWILWPSFLVGGAAEAVFFTLIDPQELYLLGEPVHWSPTAVYSVGFFLFWMIAAASSAFTCFLQRSATDVNQQG